MQSAKDKIDIAVKEYTRLQPEDFRLFKEYAAQVRDLQRTSMAEGEKGSVIERKLGEVPEKLYESILAVLNIEELNWFTAQGGNYQGPYWFYKKYPVFRITKHI